MRDARILLEPSTKGSAKEGGLPLRIALGRFKYQASRCWAIRLCGKCSSSKHQALRLLGYLAILLGPFSHNFETMLFRGWPCQQIQQIKQNRHRLAGERCRQRSQA